jgi:hypothetical protein
MRNDECGMKGDTMRFVHRLSFINPHSAIRSNNGNDECGMRGDAAGFSVHRLSFINPHSAIRITPER